MDKGEWKPTISSDITNPELMSLLDDKTANKIVQNLKKNMIPKDTPVYQGKYTGKPAAKPKAQDTDFLSQLAQKLAKTEKVCEAQRKELKQKVPPP